MIGPNRCRYLHRWKLPSYLFTFHCLYAQHSKTSRIGVKPQYTGKIVLRRQ